MGVIKDYIKQQIQIGMQRKSFERLYSPRANRSELSSAHSQHLWDALDEMQTFNTDLQDILTNEDRNIVGLKRVLAKEKIRMGKSIEHTKLEISHNLDDLKISIEAELDIVYKNYMEKYAQLKDKVMEWKHTLNEVDLEFNCKNPTLSSNYKQYSQTEYSLKNNKSVKISNLEVLRTMKDRDIEMKKQHIFHYAAQMQQQKIKVINQLSKEIMLLTQYQNEYFKKGEFQRVISKFLGGFRTMLGNIYAQKSSYIRDTSAIVIKQDSRILNEIQDTNAVNEKHIPQSIAPIVSNLSNIIGNTVGGGRNWKISRAQQTASLQWAQQLSLTPSRAIRVDSSKILLCALEVKRDVIAMGDKSGQIHIYDENTCQRITTLRGHSASICTLSLIVSERSVYLAAGSDHGCSSISLWDIESWKLKCKISEHKSAVTAVVDLQDNTTMVSGSYDKRINIYNVAEGRLLSTLDANKAGVTSIVLNSSGSKMISCSLDYSLNVWRIARGSRRQIEGFKLERIIQNNNVVCSLACSLLKPEVAYIGTMDGKIKLINTDTGEAYKTISCCENAIIQMGVVERNSQPEYPLIIARMCKEDAVKVVNSKSEKINQITVSGNIQFGCGIGPKIYFSKFKKSIGLLSQSQSQKELKVYKVDFM